MPDTPDPEAVTPLPPLLDSRPAMDQTCGRWLTDHNCGDPATWHVIWTPDAENGLCCDKHMAEALQRWSFFDRHPVMAVCTMPDTVLIPSWQDPPGYCVWRVDDPELVAAANAEMEATLA